MRSRFFDFAHVLIGKPVPTFPGHALAAALERRTAGLRSRRPSVSRLARACYSSRLAKWSGGLLGRGRALAQGGSELLLERRQRFHQGSGFQRAGSARDAGAVVGRIVRKVSLVSLR